MGFELAGEPRDVASTCAGDGCVVVMPKAAAATPSITDAVATEVKNLRIGLALAVALIVAGTIGQH
jgi:hypothetical protein